MLLKNLKIRQKLTLLLLVIGLIPTLLVSIIAYITISTQLTTKTVSQLHSIDVKQGQKIDSLLQSKQEETLILANRYDLQLALSAYLSGAAKSTSAIDAVFLDAKSTDGNIQDIYITNNGGKVLASSTEADDGAQLPPNIYNVGSGQENSVSIRKDPTDGIDKLYIVTRMNINQQNDGYLTLVYGLDDFVATIQDYTGLGNTGETIVASQSSNHKTITLFPLRFNGDAALSTNVNSLGLFNHLGSTYGGVHDYRKHPVTVSVQEIGFANWAVATIIDNKEVFAPIAQLRATLITIVVASSVAIILISLYFTRYFAAPIITLTKKTRSIMQGDFNQRIAVTSSDEVGTLTNAFNEMTESLQSSSRKLGEEHARLQASINSLELGFLMTTRDGRIFSRNPALAQLFGFANDETLTLEKIHEHFTDFDLAGAIKTCLANGAPFKADEIGYGTRFMSVIGAPIRLEKGEIIGSVIVVEDITEKKILERSKDEFFSIASHELRTPLTAIKGNTSMIMSFYPDLLKDKDVKEMLGDIHTSSIRLIDIVNDFLDVSRIEQGKILFKNEAFPIEKIIESVIYEMGPVLKEKKIYLKFDQSPAQALPLVWSDADRTKQIIYNLIGNAAKFTEQGGVTIRVQSETGLLRVTVSDTGRGIPLDKQELLFRKFQQAGNSLLTRDTAKGTGLGLYISKMLVERMGGHIALEKSEEGKGTTFSFTLPIATDEQQKASLAEQAKATAAEEKFTKPGS